MTIESIASGASAISSMLTSGKPAAGESTSVFSDILDKALDTVEGTETDNQESTAALLTGEDEAIHTAMLNAEKSYMALSLTVQIRNKVLNAYNEIMQMQL